MFFLYFNTSFLLLLFTTNTIILITISHFFPMHSMVFFISTSTKQFYKLRGFDIINYIFIQTQTNPAQWCPKV